MKGWVEMQVSDKKQNKESYFLEKILGYFSVTLWLSLYVIVFFSLKKIVQIYLQNWERS